MSDILSGGKIDESTSGPIPPNTDDRKRDILLEQRESQRDNSVGGTQFPPKTQPPPPIPEAEQVAPPLPILPSFDFSIVGSALDETREIARQTVFDVIKNVTINGQGPSIEGSSISFNVPQQPPASEVFLFQGIAIPQSQIPQIVQPQTIEQAPTQEIQSVVVQPPLRTIQPQQIEIPQETATAIQPETPKTEKPKIVSPEEIEEIKVNTPSIEPVPERATNIKPSTIEPALEVEQPKAQAPSVGSLYEEPKMALTTAFQQNNVEAIVPENFENVQIISQTPLTTTSEKIIETEKISNVLPQFKIENIKNEEVLSGEFKISTTPETEVKSQEAPKNKERSVLSEDFGTGGDRDFLKSAYTKLSDYLTFEDPVKIERQKPSRINAEDFGTGGDEDFGKPSYQSLSSYDSKSSYKEASDRRMAEKDEDFDRESGIRQKGETRKEFQERQEELRKERLDKAQEEKEKEEFLKGAESGKLISKLPSGLVPVTLTRADGQRKVLAFLASEFVGIYEGAEAGERVTSLPATSDYYITGGDNALHPFKIFSSQDPDDENTYKVTVNVGTLNNVLASNWNDEYQISSSEFKYVILTASATNNAIVSTQISLESSHPNTEQSPVQWGLPSEFKVVIGMVQGQQIWQIVYNNLSYAGIKRITTDRADPAIGQLPYANWYIWQLQ